jgi:flagellar hook-associated protein 2
MAVDLSNISTTSSGANSFAGIQSGINTTALIQAEITQASGPLNQLQSEQTANSNRSSAISSLETLMTSLSTSLATLNSSGLSARTVTSSDSTNTYASATAAGGASGSYNIQVQQTATYAQLSPTLNGSGNPTNLATSSTTASIFSGSSATFAIEDTNGVTKQITLGSGQNNINALANAINAAGATDPNNPTDVGLGVTATVINTGSGTNPYELILKSSKTGVGTAGGNFTIADVTTGGAANTLGIAAGTLSSDGTSIASGGTQSNQTAQDAKFSLDGVQLTRASNTVTDAVNGVTFNLLQGNQTGTTTLTVAPDATTATNDLQDMVSAFNALVSGYNTDTASGGALVGDGTVRGYLQQIQGALGAIPAGLASDAAYNSAASVGLSTNEDGTLSLDTNAFQAAFNADATGVTSIFASSSSSTNSVVSLGASGTSTAAGTYGFNITSYNTGGTVAGTITAPDGTQYSLTGNNGLLVGAKGTPLDGLYLNVTGTGTGSLTLSKGAGQAVQDLISNLTDPATGSITQLLTGITHSNTDLSTQIANQQSILNRMQASLEAQYSQMEATLSSLDAASSSLGSLS